MNTTLSTEPKKSAGRRIWAILGAILFIIAGIFFLKYPVASITTASMLYVCLFIGGGICQIIAYCTGRKEGASGWLLAIGIIDVLLGCYLLGHAAALLVLMPVVVGIWAIITGFGRIGLGIDERKSTRTWWLPLVVGILMVLAGMIILISPLRAIFGLDLVFACAMFVFAIQSIAGAFS